MAQEFKLPYSSIVSSVQHLGGNIPYSSGRSKIFGEYDKDGNLKDWWTAEDAKQFNLRADKLADQYSSIIVLDTVHANGRFTLGENIADHGGLRVS